jgi:hypothetical protein
LNEIRERDCDKVQGPVDIGEAPLVKANWSIDDLEQHGHLDQREEQDARSCPE